MNIKRWTVPELDMERVQELANAAKLPPLMAALLAVRGFDTPEKAGELLGKAEFSDPFLMKDMEKAVARIRRALEEGEHIAVYGDYDADGVTSTAMLYTYLQGQGARASFYIPQREGEGYGMNRAAIDTLAREGVRLIITVDNGISAIEETAYAKSLGMDVVVTDHHQPHPELPEAEAIVNPHQVDDASPFKDFSGAGVALKLLMALEGDQESVINRWGDLAAVGTVGDSVPLLGENRLLVQRGLKVIDRLERPGLAAILGAGQEKASSTKLAFSAVPCINATGRMGSPERAVRLLTHANAQAASSLARELKDDNSRRKEVEAAILRSALDMLERDAELWAQRVIVVAGKDWHMGVVGIVAARLTEAFGKPCIVLTTCGDGVYRGSGRSVEGFSIFDAVSECRDVLVRYGGHPMAAGLTVREEQVDELRRRLNAYARERHPDMPVLTLNLDCRLEPRTVSVRTVRSLSPLEPFGTGNAQPIFGICGATLLGLLPLGASGGHTKLACEKDGFRFNALRFNTKPSELPFAQGDIIDLAVNLQINNYLQGNGFDFIARDLRLSAMDPETAIADNRLYEMYLRGEELSGEQKERLRPRREHFAALYKALVKLGSAGQGSCGLPGLCVRLEPEGMNLGRLLLGLDVLRERELMSYRLRGDILRYRLLPVSEKKDLTASPLLAGLM